MLPDYTLGPIVINGMALVALGFIARSVIIHFLNKDVESFKTKLSDTATRSIEEFRSELSRKNREHEVRFQRRHDKTIAAIELLYPKLVEARYMSDSLVLAWDANNAKQFEALSQRFNDLHLEFAKQRIHLPRELVKEIQDCVNVLWRTAVTAGVWAKVDSPQNRDKAMNAYEEALEAIGSGGSVPKAIEALESAFRRTLEGAG